MEISDQQMKTVVTRNASTKVSLLVLVVRKPTGMQILKELDFSDSVRK